MTDSAAPADFALLDAAVDAFAAERPALPLAVALSGGADSTALLLACAARWPGRTEAWHVHHGLQAAADDFEQHCVALCQRLGVPLHVRRVDARAAPGQSPEDAARRHRYEAFDALALASPARAAIKTVVIAQHADDQIETVLLALSRGAGLPGLAAMPARWVRGEVAYARPLLDVPGAAIRAWLHRRGERWIEDPSTAGERFTRGELALRTRISRDGRPLWLERGVLEGGSAVLEAGVGLDGAPVSATLLVAAPACDAGLLEAWRAIEPVAGRGAVSLLPGLLVARWIGPACEPGRAWLARLWGAARLQVAGRAMQVPLIWNT